MRQVSGSAVQGLEGAALRPARLPGPRGFSLLNQLILEPGERVSRTQEQQEKEFQWREKLRAEAKQRTEKVTMPWGGGGRGGRGGGGRGDGGWGGSQKERRRGGRSAANVPSLPVS